MPSAFGNEEYPALPFLNAFKNNISVSGLSAGAFFAEQMHVAYSQHISGAAFIAGGPYWCAKNSTQTALKKCMKGWTSHETSWAEAEKQEELGNIDPLDNLKDDRVFIFSGKNDIIVAKNTAIELGQFYRKILTDKGEQRSIFTNRAGHGLPTLNYGHDCEKAAYFNAPWLLNCDYDSAGHMLRFLYPGLLAAGEFNESSLHQFSQEEFISERDSGLGNMGYVYIPKVCLEKRCRLHVSFHGCEQAPESIGDLFVTQAGYNRWAESNEIIVLYPSAKKSLIIPFNPMGCFDWWGYSGSNYHTKQGVQMKAIMAMLQRLTSS